jgi:hypothetical protein
MEKPIEIRIDETEDKIAEILNKSELPLFCIKLILNDFLNQVNIKINEEIKKYKKETKAEGDEE